MKRMRWMLVAAALLAVGACKGETAGTAPQTGGNTGGEAAGKQAGALGETGKTGGDKGEAPVLVPPIKPGDDVAAALGTPVADREYGEPETVDAKVAAIARSVMTEPGDLPRLKVAVDDKKLDLPLEHTLVQAELSGAVARVTVTQTYQNPFQEPIEAIYVFPLPENSAVDDMKIRIGERLIEAEIKKREEARRVYEEAKREGYTAALLEQERPNLFTQSVANIEPGKKIDVVIRYVQDLSQDGGMTEFVFPMVVGPRYIPGNPTDGAAGTGWARDTDQVADASRITPPIMGGGRRSGHDIDVEVIVGRSTPVIDLEVPTHDVEVSEVDGDFLVKLADHDTVPNRDFVMRYKVDGEAPQVSVLTHRERQGGFFTVIVQPPHMNLDEVVGDREIVFVVDISGSMWGVPISMCKQAMQEAIRNLRPTDVFNVMTFSGHTAKAFPESRPANQTNVRLAMDFVMNAQAGGGTNLADAVDAALSPNVADGRNRYVFFLTDGYVGNEAEIHAKARAFTDAQEAAGRRSKVFALGVGSSTNRHLLDGLADAGKGLAVYATNREDPTRAVNKFYHYIDHAVLTDIAIDWGGLAVADIYPAELPDLFASRPLVLHGRFKAPGKATIEVQGKQGDNVVRLNAEVVFPETETKNAVLETLWARARIDQLQQKLWYGQDQAVIDEITALGIDFRIVTQWTSFVAVDRSHKVGDGDPTQVVQPVEAPEGVEATMAAPASAVATRTMGPPKLQLGAMGGKGSGGAMVKERRLEKPMAAMVPSPAPEARESETAIAGDAPMLTESAKKVDDQKTAGSAHIVSIKVESGTLDPAKARALIEAQLARCRACHAKALAAMPGLKGTIAVRLTLDATGAVLKAEVVETKLSDELKGCLLSALRHVRPVALEGEVTLLVTLAVG